MEKEDTRDYKTQSTKALLFTAMFMGMNRKEHPKVRGELKKIEREIKSRFPEQYKQWKKSGADYRNIHSFFAA